MPSHLVAENNTGVPTDALERTLVCTSPYVGLGSYQRTVAQSFSFGEEEEAIAAKKKEEEEARAANAAKKRKDFF